jgi:hypothetical protein
MAIVVTIYSAKSDHGDDDDNVVETIDNAATKPRRKASEAARNILMNWLVENEGLFSYKTTLMLH